MSNNDNVAKHAQSIISQDTSNSSLKAHSGKLYSSTEKI